MNPSIKTAPVTLGADATVYVWFIDQKYACAYKSQTFCVFVCRSRDMYCKLGLFLQREYFWDSIS